jgi:hypothetical protein
VTSSPPKRILVVANRTASTPRLLETIADRSQAGSSEFLLLIPAGRKHQDWTPEDAVALVQRAAPHARVEALAAEPDALAVIERAITERQIDEIVLSTVSARPADLFRRDLSKRIEKLGLPVTVIPAEAPRPMSLEDAAKHGGPFWPG